MTERVGILTPMPSEMRPVVAALGLQKSSLAGRPVQTGKVGFIDVVVARTGMGTVTATSTTEWLLDAAAFDHVLVVGIAGGIGSIPIGAIVTPETVVNTDTGEEAHASAFGGAKLEGKIWTSNEFNPDNQRTFAPGVVAVDMETAAVGVVCEKQGIPWTAFRSISDRLDDKIVDNAVFGMANADGSPNLGAAARYILRHPTKLPGLLKVGADSTKAAKAAAGAAAAALRAVAG